MASNADVEVVRHSCRHLDGTQDLDIPVQKSNVGRIKRLNVCNLLYDTVNFNKIYIPVLIPEQGVNPTLEQGLPSADLDVPVSSPDVPVSSLDVPVSSPDVPVSSTAVRKNVNSALLTAPTPGEINISYQITSGQTLPSINESFNFDKQRASTPGIASIGYGMPSSDSSPIFNISAPPTPAAPESDTIISFGVFSSDSPPGLDISTPPSSAASPSLDILDPPTPAASRDSYGMPSSDSSSSLHISTMLTQAPPVSAHTSGQPLQSLCNMENSITATSPVQGVHQLSFKQSSSAANYSVSPAPTSADINHRMSFVPPFLAPHNVASRDGNINLQMPFRQPSPALSNSLPPASPAPGCDNSSHQFNANYPPPSPNNVINFAGPRAPAPRRGVVRLSKSAVEVLNKWFDIHSEHPYPDEETVEILSSICNITAAQVKKWFSNKRTRSKRQSKTQTPTSPTTSVSEYSFVDLRNACD